MLDENVKKYFKSPRTLKDIKADDDFNLILTFDNNEVRIYNIKNQLNGIFSVLKDKNKFRSVFLDEFGNAAWNIDESLDSSVHWNNRIDLCKDALYMDSQPFK